MKHVLTVAALCLGMLGAQAQSDKTMDMAKQPTHNCLASTTDKDWASLGLTADQTKEVSSLQMECKKMDADSKMNDNDPKKAEMMDRYTDKVKAALTPEQYDKWMKLCSMRNAEKPMKSKQMEAK